MEIINYSIYMIADFYSDGKISPRKFRFMDKTVKVEKILKRYEEKTAGNIRLVFDCIHKGSEIYKIKYEKESCKWYLFKEELIE